MATKERPRDRGRRDGRHHLRELGSELRQARLAAGLSQRHVGQAVGISHSAVSRIESAIAPAVSLSRLAEIAAVVGLRLSVRAYPTGRPLRDEAQLALLQRLRGLLPPSLRWQTETPIPIEGDLRAWDASIIGPGWTAYVDAETRIRDIQSLERRVLLKRRDTGTDRVVLLIADTRANRAILRSLPAPLIGATLPGSAILAALQSGRDPGGTGVVLL